MASGWGNKDALQEARRFQNEVTNGGRGFGRNRSVGIANPSYMNSPLVHNSSNSGQRGFGDSARSGSGSSEGQILTLATAPPEHPFFSARSVHNTCDGVINNGTKNQSSDLISYGDSMDTDELPQPPNPSLGLGSSRWGPASGKNSITQTTGSGLPTTQGHARMDSKLEGSQTIGRSTTLQTASITGTLRSHIQPGLGASMWATTTTPMPAVPHSPVKSSELVIDYDWQTTYSIEDVARNYGKAAANAMAVGDYAAKQLLFEVQKLFMNVVVARLAGDKERERVEFAAANEAVKIATPAFNKFRPTLPAQQAGAIFQAQDSTIKEGRMGSMQSHNAQPVIQLTAQSTQSAQAATAPISTNPIEEAIRVDQTLPESNQRGDFSAESPISAAPAAHHASGVPQPQTGSHAPHQATPSLSSNRQPAVSWQNPGTRSHFDDPEAVRLWENFLKRGK